MSTDDPIRASDFDRDVVVGALREAYTAGRLTLDEFDERMTAAYASKTWGDLRALTADLPVQPVLGGDVAGHHPAPPPPVPVPRHAAPPGRRRNRGAILIPAAVWALIVAHGALLPAIPILILTMVFFTLLVSSFRRH